MEERLITEDSMKAKIIIQTKNAIVIDWESDDAGFGRLEMTYQGNGTYVIDSEYMGIDCVIRIFKAIEK